MEPIRTHPKIDRRLCGTPVELSAGRARVELVPVPEMAADERGLVHGGFTFGLADYAAMLAVNDPNVVLAGSQVKFKKPVVVGETLVAEAEVASADRKMRTVNVVVRRGEEAVLEGELLCFVPERHILDR